jgi:hypothetical protein
MKILISGSHGFIGSAVFESLKKQGHTLRRLIRPMQAAHSDEVFWTPAEQYIERSKLTGTEAVIHLAGENIFGRWNDKKKQAIYDSRIAGTAFLCKTLADLTPAPKVLVCASAIGYYGSRGEHECIETADPGSGFLSQVCQDWEAATEPAAAAGIRVVNLRFGLVLGKEGGSLAKLLGAFKMGLGGPLGDGQQWVSWISLADAVRSIELVLNDGSLAGPVNVVSPHPVRNKEFAHAMGRALHRPEVVPVPKSLLHFMFGDFAEQTLLASTKVLPHKLQQVEFQFLHPNLDEALHAILQQ